MKNAIVSGSMPARNVIGRFVVERSTLIVEIISALFILLFLYTAINKSNNITPTVNVIKRTPIISSIPEFVAWAVVITEYIASILLFLSRTRKIGLIVSLGLMSLFTIYIGYMKLFITKLPCSCGGVIAEMTWTQHLLFNLLFILLATLALQLFKNQRKHKTSNT